MEGWLVPPRYLTIEQKRAVGLPTNMHQVITGGPGSGKTLILAHRAAALRSRMPSADFRIFIYTRVLQDYLRAGLRDLDIDPDAVCTYDSWCRSMYREHCKGRLPRDGRSLDFAAIRQGVRDWFVQNDGAGDFRYDFVLVDEGQDLDTPVYETLRRVARHVTVVMDGKQQLYDVGMSEREIVHALGRRHASATLLAGRRCSPYVIALAAVFVVDEFERKFLEQQECAPPRELQPPLLYLAHGFDDQCKRLVDMVRERLAKGDRVGILVPSNRTVYRVARSLSEGGIEAMVKRDIQEGGYESSRPKVLTYHSAKGLTFDSVLLPLLDRRHFRKVDEASVLRMLFVGVTRATGWVYMSATDGAQIAALSRVEELGARGKVTIQHKADLLDPDDGDDDDDDDDPLLW